VAVGATQFNEGPGSYWRDPPDAYGTAAMGYIPEMAWNESGSVPGGGGLWASGGGMSGIFPKPGWQLGKGVPGTCPHRCLPDVSLAGAGHDGYRVATSGVELTTGGTSCSAPAFAGIMALVVQKTGERQGNANPAFYKLANLQFQGTGPAVFHDIVDGGTTVPGTEGYPCTPGYDLATGLGTVDAQALVGAWGAGQGNNILATIVAPPADLTVAGGTPLRFQGQGQDSNPSVLLSYLWDFGDGSIAAGATAYHTYWNAGPGNATYTASLSVADSPTNQAADTRTIIVRPGPLPGELIVNGGFEEGTTSFVLDDVSVPAR
jgi:hypothetical protein